MKHCFTIAIALTLCEISFTQNNSFSRLVSQADSVYDAGKLEIALALYGKAFDLAKTKQQWIEAVASLIGMAYCHQDLEQLATADQLLEQELAGLEQHPGVPPFHLAKAIAVRGLTLRLMEKYPDALKSYEKAIGIYERIGANHRNVAYAYKNAATIYERRLNYKKAIDYLEKGLTTDSSKTYESSIYVELANCYHFLKEDENAEKYCELGLATQPGFKDKARIDAIYANVLAKKGDYEKAAQYTKSSLGFFKTQSNYWENCVRGYCALGQIAHKTGDFIQAENWYKLGLQFINEHTASKNREIALIHTEFGNFYKVKGNFDSALSHYQQALIQVFPRFNSTHIADNPDPKDIYTESWIMTAAARKAEALQLRFAQKGNVADLYNAAECYDLSLAGVRELHKSYGSETAKLYMGDYSHSYFEQAIEVNYLLHRQTGEQAFLQKIFSLMEQSKAAVLSEAIQKNKALLLAGIPDSLLEREQELRIAIADFTTQLRDAEATEGQDQASDADKVKSQLADYQLQYERLVEKLKADFPNFRAFTEEAPLPDFAAVTGRLLGDKALFVEYFSGEKALYCLAIGRQGASIFKVDRKAEFDALVQQYLAFFRDANSIVGDPEGYLCCARDLYEALFAKNISAANTQPADILIVPDGLLGYLPFDALVTGKGGAGTGFSNVDFFIKKYNLRYGYSANVLLQQSESRRRKGELLRVMPRFGAGERGLPPLKYSDEETSGLRSSWHSLDGALATVEAFKQIAAKCRLIHLSTHAASNSAQGEPRIELSDGALLLPELYAMNLSAADLVVLSACETGLGKVEKGEGVMSLARGFAYAGASSLVASLWKVNERSTATLFAHFYQTLRLGKTKSEALRLAKLSLLEQAGSDARQSPYYWAGFVFMGNDGEMDLSNGLPIWAWALLVLAILLWGGWFYWRKRKARLVA